MKKIMLVFAFASSFLVSAHAEVKVDNAWVRGTVAAQNSTGAFMTISSDKPVSLVGASSPTAKTVEIHEMKVENNLMTMRAVTKLAVVPGKLTELRPGSYHVMLFNLVKPLAAGDSVPITLEFEGEGGKRVKQEVNARVREVGASTKAKR